MRSTFIYSRTREKVKKRGRPTPPRRVSVLFIVDTDVDEIRDKNLLPCKLWSTKEKRYPFSHKYLQDNSKTPFKHSNAFHLITKRSYVGRSRVCTGVYRVPLIFGKEKIEKR